MKAVSLTLLSVLLVSNVFAQHTTNTLKNERRGSWDITVQYPVFRGTDRLTRLANETISRWANQQFQEFLSQSRSELPELRKMNANVAYYLSVSPKVTMDSSRIKSVVFTVSQYTGGAHPVNYFKTFNFGYVSGNPASLNLDDLFSPGADFATQASNGVLSRLMDNEQAPWVQDGEVRELDSQTLEMFTIGRNWITWYGGNYVFGPYVAGTVEVRVPFSELPGLNPRGPLQSLLR